MSLGLYELSGHHQNCSISSITIVSLLEAPGVKTSKGVTGILILSVGLLTHWGRMIHICISKFTIMGSDDGLSPGQPQAIFWTNTGILLIWPLGTNFSELLIEVHIFTQESTFEKGVCKMLAIFLCLNVLNVLLMGNFSWGNKYKNMTFIYGCLSRVRLLGGMGAYLDGIMQHCRYSILLTRKIMPSCIKPLI